MTSLTVSIATEADKDRYNAFVAGSTCGDLLQSWEWGEIKRRSGWTPKRYLVEKNGETVGAASVLRTVPIKGAPPLLYSPRGPVFQSAEVLTALIERIRHEAGNAFVLKVDPPIERDSDAAGALLQSGFIHAKEEGFGGVQPRAVMVLDISRGPDKVFEGFKQKWRYNIRLAERKGVVVSEGTRDDLPEFYDLLLETAARDGFFVRGRSYFETLYDMLTPAGMVKLWLARYEGRAIAGAICFRFGKRVTYVYGASSNLDRKVMPNHLMQWTMIQWAIASGAAVYDFRGVSPMQDGKPVEEHIAGLNRFKEGFGATYVEYVGDLDLPLRPLIWRTWVTAFPFAMQVYKKIKKGSGSAAE